ncbi:hypothetical protein KP509_14G038300 [Ceratopteris richardii]|uniref:Uncharacterized protein n=1 Tax=Ceratopteris richardii TaxID=49495 RepID=A0A8T2TB43_CERRI|nr:hypothetical protein KP509_14G038300 [Ceratopteris richardii]
MNSDFRTVATEKDLDDDKDANDAPSSDLSTLATLSVPYSGPTVHEEAIPGCPEHGKLDTIKSSKLHTTPLSDDVPKPRRTVTTTGTKPSVNRYIFYNGRTMLDTGIPVTRKLRAHLCPDSCDCFDCMRGYSARCFEAFSNNVVDTPLQADDRTIFQKARLMGNAYSRVFSDRACVKHAASPIAPLLPDNMLQLQPAAMQCLEAAISEQNQDNAPTGNISVDNVQDGIPLCPEPQCITPQELPPIVLPLQENNNISTAIYTNKERKENDDMDFSKAFDFQPYNIENVTNDQFPNQNMRDTGTLESEELACYPPPEYYYSMALPVPDPKIEDSIKGANMECGDEQIKDINFQINEAQNHGPMNDCFDSMLQISSWILHPPDEIKEHSEQIRSFQNHNSQSVHDYYGSCFPMYQCTSCGKGYYDEYSDKCFCLLLSQDLMIQALGDNSNVTNLKDGAEFDLWGLPGMG